MTGPRILASVVSVDQGEIGAAACRLLDAGVDGLHLDISDGEFVPDLTFGLRTVDALRARTEAFLDVHLMVARPEDYLDGLAHAGATRVSFHVEAAPYPWRVVSLARSLGLECGVALNPVTPLATVEDLSHSVDFVNLLTTEPDHAGQRLLSGMAARAARLRELLPKHVRLQVDGGIDRSTVSQFADADDLVVGRGICGEVDWAEAVADLRRRIGSAIH